MVNNVGVFSFGFIEWVLFVDFKKVVDVNLWGMMDVIKIFLFLVKKVKGCVVFVSSIVGKYELRENEIKDRLYMSFIWKMNFFIFYLF